MPSLAFNAPLWRMADRNGTTIPLSVPRLNSKTARVGKIMRPAPNAAYIPTENAGTMANDAAKRQAAPK